MGSRNQKLLILTIFGTLCFVFLWAFSPFEDSIKTKEKLPLKIEIPVSKFNETSQNIISPPKKSNEKSKKKLKNKNLSSISDKLSTVYDLDGNPKEYIDNFKTSTCTFKGSA